MNLTFDKTIIGTLSKECNVLIKLINETKQGKSFYSFVVKYNGKTESCKIGRGSSSYGGFQEDSFVTHEMQTIVDHKLRSFFQRVFLEFKNVSPKKRGFCLRFNAREQTAQIMPNFPTCKVCDITTINLI